MQIKLFTIPLLGGEALNEDLNAFLRSKKILHIDNHLLNNAQGCFWCFCIKYIEDKTISDTVKVKIDYKEVLDAASFERFSNMRAIRKQIAQQENLPAYAIFTDDELSSLAKTEDLDQASMKKIKGIGEKKIEKYSQYFISPK
jgi:superfamily II DNA helicase RecQ